MERIYYLGDYVTIPSGNGAITGELFGAFRGENPGIKVVDGKGERFYSLNSPSNAIIRETELNGRRTLAVHVGGKY